jgi:hypothetical protein
VFVFAYALRVSERPVCMTPEALEVGWCGLYTLGTKDFRQFSVALWACIISSLTVGYGDVFAVTHAGRFVTVMLCLWGVVCVALLINAVANATQLKSDERRAFEALLRHKYGLQRRVLAKQLRSSFIKFAIHYRRATGTRFGRPGMSMSMMMNASASGASTTQNPLYKSAHHGGTSGHGAGSVRMAGGVGVGMPHSVVHGLVQALEHWREHDRVWYELTREKDDLGMLQRDVVELATRHTEATSRMEAEVDRLAILCCTLASQLQVLLASLPSTMTQMAGISSALKVQVPEAFSAAQKAAEEAAALKPPSLELPVDVNTYEKKRREMERFMSSRAGLLADTRARTTAALNTLHGRTHVNGRPIHTRVDAIFRAAL